MGIFISETAQEKKKAKAISTDQNHVTFLWDLCIPTLKPHAVNAN